jgi:hypothetical protein
VGVLVPSLIAVVMGTKILASGRAVERVVATT